MEHPERTDEEDRLASDSDDGVEGPPPERFDEDPARNPADENLKDIKGG